MKQLGFKGDVQKNKRNIRGQKPRARKNGKVKNEERGVTGGKYAILDKYLYIIGNCGCTYDQVLYICVSEKNN